MTNQKKRNTLTITDGAGLLGISRQALSRTLKRHNVQPLDDGRYDAVQVFTAFKSGALADKNTLSASDTPADDLHRQRLESQIRLLDIQCSRAQHELDVVTQQAIPIEEFNRRRRDIVLWLKSFHDVWIKTTSAAMADAGIKRKLEDTRRTVYQRMQEELTNENPS